MLFRFDLILFSLEVELRWGYQAPSSDLQVEDGTLAESNLMLLSPPLSSSPLLLPDKDLVFMTFSSIFDLVFGYDLIKMLSLQSLRVVCLVLMWHDFTVRRWGWSKNIDNPTLDLRCLSSDAKLNSFWIRQWFMWSFVFFRTTFFEFTLSIILLCDPHLFKPTLWILRMIFHISILLDLSLNPLESKHPTPQAIESARPLNTCSNVPLVLICWFKGTGEVGFGG